MNRYYYNLNTLISDLLSDQSVMQELEIGNPVFIGLLNVKLIMKLAQFAAPGALTTTTFDKTEMNNLLCTYIFPKYKDMAVCYVDKEDGEPTTAEITAAKKIFVRHLLNNIRTTYDEYKLLIDTFTAEKDNLMNAIKTQTKFNDTPQTTTTAGVVSYNDTYNSTVTTNYSDGASKIARIAEIEALIKDYYEKWCNTVCKGLFIYEE